MQEIVKLVVEKTGISEDLATKAVDVVQDYLQKNLPGGIGEQVKGILGGDPGGVSGLADKAGDIAKGLGGLLGKDD